jgi:hypothetical protein
MAVSIVTHPTSNSAKVPGYLSDPFVWSLKQSDIGTSTLQNKIAYRILIEGGAQITRDKSIMPTINDEILNFDINYLLSSLLHTNVPDPTTWATTDADMFLRCRLQPGETIIDFSDPDNNGTTWDTQSDLYYILNTYFQNWQDRPDTSISGYCFALQDLPLNKMLYRGSTDFLYSWSDPFDGGGDFTLFVANKDGNTASTTIGSLSGLDIHALSAEHVAAQFGAFWTEENLAYFRITIGTQTCTWLVADSCAHKKIELYFKQPKGGYSLEAMECIDKIQVSKTGSTILRETSASDFATQKYLADFGTVFLSYDKFVKVTLSKKIKINEKNIRYYEALGASSKYLASYLNPDAGKVGMLEGFIPEKLDMPVLVKGQIATILITGYYAHGFQSHIQ